MANLIPINQAESQMQMMQESGLSKDEIKILQSASGTLIKNASVSDLNGLILYCISLSGINPSNYPLEADKTILIDFLLSNYGSFALDEVKTAFQMNAAGRFGDTIEHFQNFSPSYLGKIMTAFRRKSEDLRKYQEGTGKWNRPVQSFSRRDELSNEYMVQSGYEHYCRLGRWDTLYPNCYETLKYHGVSPFTADDEFNFRVKFNQSGMESKSLYSVNKDRQFNQWLTSLVFEQFKAEGRKQVFNFTVYERAEQQIEYFRNVNFYDS